MDLTKISRKIIAMSLALCMTFGCAITGVGSYIGLSTTVSAAETTKSGLEYETQSDGTVTITGYSGSASSVVIPSKINGRTVTSIGEHAFYDCTSLTSVTIPDSVTSIGEYAFSGCAGLTGELKIPDSVTTIGSDAFELCTGLTSLTIGNGVTSIGDYAFSGCKGLTSITIPDSVTSIGDYAFYCCTALKSVTIPNSVKSIGNYAFYWCSALESITISNNVTAIGDYAFYCCTALKSVTIPNSVKSIGDGAFSYCFALTGITIPNSVTSIGDTAFCVCTGLKSITVSSGNAKYSSQDGALFNKDRTVLIAYPCGKSESTYKIPDSVTVIGDYAFKECDNLNSVTISNSVTAIADWAFYNCSALKNITIPNSVKSIGNYAFCECTALTSLTIPNSVTSIGSLAFYGCDAFKSVTIPNSVKSIGDSAFGYTADDFIVHCNAGSYAESYAKKNNIKYDTGLYNLSEISNKKIHSGSSVKITGNAIGGTTPYQYAFSAKHSTATDWTTLKGYSTTATKTWTPGKTGTYQLCAKVKDAKGTEVKKFFTITVNESLINKSTISKTTINKGDSVTLKGAATGGTSPYQYAFTAKHSTATAWTTIKSYSTTATKTWKPEKTGTYKVCAKVKDAKGTEVKKFFTLTVNESLINKSTISKTTINKGDSVTLKGAATGGTSPYQYAFTAKHSTATAWTTLKGYSTTSTKTWTPGKTGKYSVCLKVKNAKGTEVKKFFTLTVNAASGLANISTISKTTINKGESVTLTGLGAGGTTPYQYAFSAKHSTATTWTTIKGYNTTSTKVWTPGLKGTYEVCAKVKDAKGTEVKKFFTLTVN